MTAVGTGPGGGRSSNLPRAASSFVGRGPALAALAGLLETAALLTITGAGGTGKTRLALESARPAVRRYPDGVWLVELAPLADPPLVPQAVAGVLGVRERPGEALADTLAAALAPRRLLLVLDNCEHLLDACAALVDALLRACPHVRVLATSRESLRVPGETVWRAPPLETPPPGVTSPEALAANESVRLFVERAAAARHGFVLSAENSPAVAELCRRLDGIPLALELAAARAAALPVGDLLGLLRDRFRLLTVGTRTALPRQQTLAATLDWSYDLLTESERALFRRLAVFAGGWSLAAAERVAADPAGPPDAVDASGGGGLVPADGVLDALSRLVDRSLVVAEEDGQGRARFRMLETLREYAWQHLLAGGQADTVLRRHLAYFTSLVEAAEPVLEGPAQRRCLDGLEAELDNCRVALRWVVDHPEPETVEQGLRLAGSLPWFWFKPGPLREARMWLDAVLGVPAASPPSPTRARALAESGVLAGFLGDTAAAHARREQCAALVREAGLTAAVARALLELGPLLMHLGRTGDALAWLEASEAIFREAGDERGLAFTAWKRGSLARLQSDWAAARRAYEESADRYRRLGNPDRTAGALGGLAATLLADGDPEGARPLFEEALAIWRELGYENGIAGALNHLGEIALAAGDPARAAARFAEAAEWYRGIGRPHDEALVQRNLARMAQAAGDAPEAHRRMHAALALWLGLGVGVQRRVAETLEALAAQDAAAAPERALRLAGSAAAVRDACGHALSGHQRAALDAALAPARRRLSAAAAAAALAAGRSLSPDAAVDEVFAGGGPVPPDGPPPAERTPAARRAFPAANTPEGPPDGPLRVDPDTFTVWRGRQPLPRPLAAKEFALVAYLSERPGRVCSRQELGDAVWGRDRWDPDMLYRLVRRVKEKLELHPARPRYLQNVPGFGYRLVP